jgi:hypothetical protein
VESGLGLCGLENILEAKNSIGHHLRSRRGEKVMGGKGSKGGLGLDSIKDTNPSLVGRKSLVHHAQEKVV